MAVRSSGVAEDSSLSSYAGQFETVLGVDGVDGVVDAIGAVALSAFEDRLAAYEDALGSGDGRLAVLVQRLVPAEAAGVAFSANPVTGARSETLVHAVAGLGEGLVGGEITPDEFVVTGDDVDTSRVANGVIDAHVAREVASLADRLEEILGAPQDVEWARAGGRLHLLQARPITALPTPPVVDLPDGTWTKDTSHYTQPMSPLGASTYLNAVAEGATAMCRDWGLLVDRIDQRSVGGEVYIRVSPLGGESTSTPPWWLIAAASRVVPSMRRRVVAARRRLSGDGLDDVVDRWRREWRPGMRAAVDRLRSRDLTAMDDTSLSRHLDETLGLLHRGQWVHFHLFIPYTIGLHELASRTDELLGWTASQTMDLLQGLSSASSEPSRALRTLAGHIRAVPEARRLVATRNGDALDRLPRMDPSIAEAVGDFRDRWAMRTVNYDPGSPTLAERRDLLVGLLADAVEADGARPDEDLDTRRRQAQERARTELEAQGIDPEERRSFEEALAFAERVYPLREDNVFWTDNAPSAMVRLAVLEIGDRLRERSVLDRAADVVWLNIDEIRELFADEADRRDLTSRIERRKGEHRFVEANPGPPIRGTEPAPPPDVRGLPPDARRTNAALLWMMGMELHRPGDEDPSIDLTGSPASPGRYTGAACLVRSERDFDRLRPGGVLVSPVTTPAWSMLFTRAGAVVTDHGGPLSRAAIVAREHGIPAVLGTGDVTRRLRDGMEVTVDGSRGTITIREE